MEIYITYCSGTKDNSLQHSKKRVTPDKLYTSTKRIQPFIRRCKEEKVNWAIFSDKYGVWFPNIRHSWYDKHPNKVTKEEFKELIVNFDVRLRKYNKIYFYYNSGRFHNLYRRLLRRSNLRDKIQRITSIEDIVNKSLSCKWLHEELEQLPLIMHPFNLDDLPDNGVYFYYEDKEYWRHSRKRKQSIVRVGTHTGDGNFPSRIAEHYLSNYNKYDFTRNTPKPSDRSIFRKNIGRALLNKVGDNYLDIWNKDFTSRDEREKYKNKRRIGKEQKLEEQITDIIRKKFTFRYIIVDNEVRRKKLEKSLIGTLNKCEICYQSQSWLGNFSPVDRIRKGGLWLYQHLNERGLNESDKKIIRRLIIKTKKWLNG